MSWLVLVSIATILYSISALADKFFCSKRFKNSLSYLVTVYLIQIVFITSILFLGKYNNLSGWPLWSTLISGLAYLFLWILYYKALEKVEASRAAAIYNLEIVFAALLSAVFLGEKIIGLKWLAIVLITLGAGLCSYEKSTTKEKFNISYLLIVLSALIGGVGGVLTKIASTTINPFTIYILAFYTAIPIVLLFLKNKVIRSEVKEVFLDKKALLTITANRLIYFISVCFFYLAMVKGPVSSVAAILGTSPVLVFIFSTIISLILPKIIKEKITPAILIQKIFAIAIIIIGVVIISK